MRRWIATFVGFFGVLIIVRPSPDEINFYALLAIFSAALVACNLIMTKTLAATESPKHNGLSCWYTDDRVFSSHLVAMGPTDAT